MPAYARLGRGRLLLGHDQWVELPPPVHCKSDSSKEASKERDAKNAAADQEDGVNATKRYYQLRLKALKVGGLVVCKTGASGSSHFLPL